MVPDQLPAPLERWTIPRATQESRKYGPFFRLEPRWVSLPYSDTEPMLPPCGMQADRTWTTYGMMLESQLNELCACVGERVVGLMRRGEPLGPERAHLLRLCTERRSVLRGHIVDLLGQTLEREEEMPESSKTLMSVRGGLYQIEHEATKIRLHLEMALYQHAIREFHPMDGQLVYLASEMEHRYTDLHNALQTVHVQLQKKKL